MIDSRAGGNFISKRFVEDYGIATQTKDTGYELVAVNGSPLPNVREETIPLPLTS